MHLVARTNSSTALQAAQQRKILQLSLLLRRWLLDRSQLPLVFPSLPATHASIGSLTALHGQVGVAMGELPVHIMEVARRPRLGLPCPVKLLPQTAGRAEWASAPPQAAWHARGINRAVVRTLADLTTNLRAELDIAMTSCNTKEGACLHTVVDNSGPLKAFQATVKRMGRLVVVCAAVLTGFSGSCAFTTLTKIAMRLEP